MEPDDLRFGGEDQILNYRSKYFAELLGGESASGDLLQDSGEGEMVSDEESECPFFLFPQTKSEAGLDKDSSAGPNKCSQRGAFHLVKWSKASMKQ